jgi:hypothetical protein
MFRGPSGKLVKLDKLAKQAHRDLLANPKKAAILGLMLLVALYFWGPLLWKWFAPAGGKKGSKDQAGLILEDDPAQATEKAKTGVAAAFRWEKVRQLIQNDRLMVPAAYEAEWPNPFATPKSSLSPEQTQSTAPKAGAGPEKAASEITPDSAALKLASVAIGPRRRTATIDGETYSEGELVTVEGKDPKHASALGFRIVRIEPRGVQLEREGKTWWLEFEQPRLAHGDEIERVNGSDPN